MSTSHPQQRRVRRLPVLGFPCSWSFPFVYGVSHSLSNGWSRDAVRLRSDARHAGPHCAVTTITLEGLAGVSRITVFGAGTGHLCCRSFLLDWLSPLQPATCPALASPCESGAFFGYHPCINFTGSRGTVKPFPTAQKQFAGKKSRSGAGKQRLSQRAVSTNGQAAQTQSRRFIDWGGQSFQM